MGSKKKKYKGLSNNYYTSRTGSTSDEGSRSDWSYSGSDPSYSRMMNSYDNFYKKFKGNEMVSPKLSSYSYNSLTRKLYTYLIDKYIKRNNTNNDDIIQSIQGLSNSHQLEKLIPSDLIHDIFLLYYLPDSVIKLNSANHPFKYRIVSKVYDSLIKIITEKRTINSYFITEIIVEYLLSLFIQQTSENQKALQSCMSDSDNCDNLSSGEKSDIDDLINSINKTKIEIQDSNGNIRNNSLQQLIEKAIKKADSVEKAYDELGVKQPSLSDQDRGNFDFSNIEKVRKITSSVIISRDNITNMFKQLINKFKKDFSVLYDLKTDLYIDNSEDFLELLDLEHFVNPTLRNVLLDETLVTTKHYKGKVDLYLDSSGSMGANGDPNSMLTLAKGVALRFIKYKLVNKLYFFSDRVSEPFSPKKVHDILAYNNGGGTSFNHVIDNVNTTGQKSIIITDGEDRTNMYNSNINWIGVSGSDFSSFSSYPESNKFLSENRCFYYRNNQLVRHNQGQNNRTKKY